MSARAVASIAASRSVSRSIFPPAAPTFCFLSASRS